MSFLGRMASIVIVANAGVEIRSGRIDIVRLPNVLNIGLLWSCGCRFNRLYRLPCSKAWTGLKLALIDGF